MIKDDRDKQIKKYPACPNYGVREEKHELKSLTRANCIERFQCIGHQITKLKWKCSDKWDRRGGRRRTLTAHDYNVTCNTRSNLAAHTHTTLNDRTPLRTIESY